MVTLVKYGVRCTITQEAPLNSTDILNNAMKNEREMFLAKLKSFTVLDIGTIVEVKEGRARVNGSSFIGGQQTIYDNVEVVYPGNEGGTYDAECAGTPCLIFIPMSCMPDITNRNVRLRSAAYSGAGIKVMPIGNSSQSIVKTKFSAGGIFSVLTKNYSLSFAEDSINLERGDVAASVNMDEEGGLHVIKQGENSTHYLDMVDGSSKSTWISKNKDVQWTDTLNSDGSRTFVQNDPQDESADPLFSMTIAADGTLQVNTAADISVSTTGDANITADQINLNGDDTSFVTYTELNNALTAEVTGLLDQLNNHTHSNGNEGGPTGAPITPLQLDISAAEATTVKTASGS